MSAVLLIALISESAETLTVQVTVTVYFIFLFRVKRGRHAPDKKNSNSSRVHVQVFALTFIDPLSADSQSGLCGKSPARCGGIRQAN